MSTIPSVQGDAPPNGRPVSVTPPPPRVDVITLLTLTLRALSGHAIRWAGLALAFSLFAWIVASPTTPAWAKLVAAGGFGVMVLVLWIRLGQR